MSNIQKNDLSDLDIENIDDGFTIIFDGDKPIAVIAKINYYNYIMQLIKKVKTLCQSK